MNAGLPAYEPPSQRERLRAVLEAAPFDDEELSEEEEAALANLDQLRGEESVDSEEIRKLANER